MVSKNQCMDNSEVKSDEITDTGGTITFQGWNISKPKEIILEELEEYYNGDYQIKDFVIIKKKEHAFQCNRFAEGEDAKDNGYSYWLEYDDIWKKGLGKCTTFTVKYRLIKIEHGDYT